MTVKGKPYYRAFPSNFLTGCNGMKADEQGIYRCLLDLMYDKWVPLPWNSLGVRAKREQQQKIARQAGTTVQRLNAVLVSLLASKKITLNDTGDLTNPRFERERANVAGDISPKTSAKLDALNDSRLNDNKGLNGGLTRARDSIVHIPDSTVPGKDQRTGGLSEPAEQIIESEISQICTAIGVNLTGSTHRFAWPARWVEMRDKDRLTVADMLAAIATFSGQFRGETVKSLGLYRDRAIEKRVARELSDRITSRSTATANAVIENVDHDEWTKRLRQFIELGSWAPSYGPSPLEPGCRVPHRMLDNAERYWIDNGNHPRAMHHGGTKDLWAPGKAGSVRQVTPFADRSTRFKE